MKILECCCVRSRSKESEDVSVVDSPEPVIPIASTDSMRSEEVSSPHRGSRSSTDDALPTQDHEQDVPGGSICAARKKDHNLGLKRRTLLRPQAAATSTSLASTVALSEDKSDSASSAHSDSSSSEPVPPVEKLKAASRFLMTISGKRGMRRSQMVSGEDVQTIPLEQKQWLEALDKGHRAGGDLKEFYKLWEKSDTTQSFFDWLDNNPETQKDLPSCPRSRLDNSNVKYCTISERQQYLVEVSDGILRYKQSGDLVDGKLIFVMGVKGHLFMGKKTKGHFQHSSFLAGTPVLVAGSVHMEMGRFLKLMPYSGHYRPKREHFNQFLLRMRDKGLISEQCSFLEAEVDNPDFFDKSIRGK